MRRVTATAVMLTALLMGGCSTRTARTTATGSPRPSSAEPQRSGAVSGGSVIGSCVQQYSLSALEQRAYAFDGVVRRIDRGVEDKPDRIAFGVNEWFKGGSGGTASRRAYGFTMTTSAGGSPHVVGQRLLVAGDEDFVWDCGFTQPYKQNVAGQWRSTLRQ